MVHGSRSDRAAAPAGGVGAEYAARTAARAADATEAISVRFAMRTDVGRVRSANEDACGAEPARDAFVVCDGMGGAASGDLASQLARDIFLEHLRRPGGSAKVRLAEAVRAANQTVLREAQRSRVHRGMGTTLVGVLCERRGQRPSAWVVHVGDSRCYRLRAGRLDLLTRDHSLIQEQIEAGLMTVEEAESSPIRNIITRAIGSHATVEPEIAEHALEPGDLLLLASDGLTRELCDEEITEVLRRHTADGGESRVGRDAAALEQCCKDLVDAANRSGGRDNITVVLIAVG